MCNCLWYESFCGGSLKIAEVLLFSADLITAMTWPIDLAEELRELEDEIDESDHPPDYTLLIQAQRSYKASLLTPGVLKALFDIMIPPLAKEKKLVIFSPPQSSD